MHTRLSDYYYELPKGLIAQTPIANRSDSRLLALSKETGAITHGVFSDIIGMINPGDCLVINETRVIPARLFARKETGSKVEVLLLKRLDDNVWEALVKPGSKARPGDTLLFGGGAECRVRDVIEDGVRIVEFRYEGVFETWLSQNGETPLPPYITERLDDRERYQTVYATVSGSAAAPTAGLHFTRETLSALERRGVKIARLILHVGLGTFRPVKCDNILDHKMHSEYYEIPPETADMVNEAKRQNKRVICVGTTSLRAVESSAENGLLSSFKGETDIFIYPGYTFKIVDALITNFHLPESTLLMLVSAMAGRENVLGAYAEAVEMGYRFFSFGDCMAIL